MKKVWEYVNKLEYEVKKKNRIFLTSICILSMLFGGLVWFCLFKNILQGYLWLMCFMGYPCVFVGLIGGITYLYNHEFR